MRRLRKMTWAILIWTGLFVLWGASGVSAVSDECVGMIGNGLSLCQSATAIGGGIGLSLISSSGSSASSSWPSCGS